MGILVFNQNRIPLNVFCGSAIEDAVTRTIFLEIDAILNIKACKTKLSQIPNVLRSIYKHRLHIFRSISERFTLINSRMFSLPSFIFCMNGEIWFKLFFDIMLSTEPPYGNRQIRLRSSVKFSMSDLWKLFLHYCLFKCRNDADYCTMCQYDAALLCVGVFKSTGKLNGLIWFRMPVHLKDRNCSV